MKKIFIYITIALGLTISSCNDFLDVESRSKMTEEEVFETTEDAYKAIQGIYAALSHNRIYGLQTSTYYGCNNDIEFATTNAVPEDTRRGLWDYTATSSNTEIEGFIYMYIAINRANECIAGIEKSKLFAESATDKPSTIRHLYGEAMALRALMYLELTRNWGDVPFKDKPTQYNDDFYIGATSRDTIQAHIIQDLINVEPLMFYASDIPEHVERMNRGAVQGLIARIALTRGGWSLRPNLANPSDPGYMHHPTDSMEYFQIANTYCEKLIYHSGGQHDLISSFKDVFYNQCQEVYPSNDDMLYEVAMALNYSGAIGHSIGVRIERNTNSPYGFSNPYYSVTLPYMFSFDPKDSRRDVSCCPYSWYWEEKNQRLEQQMASPTSKVSIGKWSKLFMKYPQGSGAESNTGINWPVIRFADVLLMHAESELKLGNGEISDQARESLKRVRQRAFAPTDYQECVEDYVNNLTDKESFFKALVNERAWEFAGECIRKYDLIRWNMLRSKLIELKVNMQLLGQNTREQSGIYANKPAYLYYKKLNDGTLDIVGFDRNLQTAPAGYTAYAWCRDLVSDNLKLRGQFDYYWRDEIIQSNPMVYLYPFHKDVISESKGALKNYYGKQ